MIRSLWWLRRTENSRKWSAAREYVGVGGGMRPNRDEERPKVKNKMYILRLSLEVNALHALKSVIEKIYIFFAFTHEHIQ